MKREDVLTALMNVGPPIIDEPGMIPNHCIVSTRVGIAALHYFKVQAKPLACNVGIYNEKYLELSKQGAFAVMTPKALLESGAWSLQIDTESPGPDYSGHLIIDVSDHENPGEVLDLNFGQFRREHKHILAPPAAAFSMFDKDKSNLYRFDGYSVIYEVKRPDDERWRKASDWTRPSRETITKVIEAMKEFLEGL